ncbi:MAG: pantoate--beta-alanine ligase, partial [Armatimonadetes bacterium]|nr:pantoate--beta-alanine ligase [Armatimonadota bacterium]
READGLAVSTRNQYLNTQQRAAAPQLYQALQHGAEAARKGASGTEVEEAVRKSLANELMFAVQYVQAVDPETLQPLGKARAPMVIAAAVYLGDTRLIDNIKIEEDATNAENDG